MSRRANYLVFVLAAGGLLALFAYALTRDPKLVPSPLVGRPAPSFRLPGLDGRKIALDDLAGRVVLVNFWASYCGPCREEHAALLRAHRDLSARGLSVVGIVYQDDPEEARRFLAEMGGGYPAALDPGSRAAVDYGVFGVPESFLIDRKGIIVHKQIGPFTGEEIEKRVIPILQAH